MVRLFPRGRRRRHVPEGHAEPLSQCSKPRTGDTLQRVDNAGRQFGGLVAVNDVSFEVNGADYWPDRGANGADKSTAFNLETGVLWTISGQITHRVVNALISDFT
jgi:ABC-type sugar transport system ATPase subunit